MDLSNPHLIHTTLHHRKRVPGPVESEAVTVYHTNDS